MTFLDWSVIWVPTIFAMAFAIYTARFNKSVVDFIAAGRCAGRFLLATAGGEAGSSAVTAIALFQMTTKTGFAFGFWGPLYTTIPILLGLLGWVTYRARETRVLSGGQFFEIRYNRSLRLFMGLIGFLSGMLASGVGPAVGGRFLVYYLHLPETTWVGGLGFATWQLVALAYMGISVLFVLTGGAISVLISNCLEGMFSLVGYLIIIIALLFLFGWGHMVETLTAQPPGKSMVNPFDMKDTQDFNIWFILISLFQAVWAPQPIGASSAKSPHEQRMAGILGSWRNFGFGMMRTLVAICALVYLTNPHFAAQSATAHSAWSAIADKGVRDQMQVPIAASYYLPWGLKGLFCSLMLMGLLGGTAMGLHVSGTGFIQDVVLPIFNYLKVEMPQRDSTGGHHQFLFKHHFQPDPGDSAFLASGGSRLSQRSRGSGCFRSLLEAGNCGSGVDDDDNRRDGGPHRYLPPAARPFAHVPWTGLAARPIRCALHDALLHCDVRDGLAVDMQDSVQHGQDAPPREILRERRGERDRAAALETVQSREDHRHRRGIYLLGPRGRVRDFRLGLGPVRDQHGLPGLEYDSSLDDAKLGELLVHLQPLPAFGGRKRDNGVVYDWQYSRDLAFHLQPAT